MPPMTQLSSRLRYPNDDVDPGAPPIVSAAGDLKGGEPLPPAPIPFSVKSRYGTG